ncbi:MAG TPA: DinB superfamily protein [Cytophagales bacterium]|nr:DinB superfamily protein [Cytophagales bacterium]
MVQDLKKVYLKDLQKLKEEISLYRDEQSLWKIEKEISNSAGNLCLHLIGNLNHFIGATMGHSGYVRNRDQEFAAKNILQKELIKMVEETIEVVDKTLSSTKDEELVKEYPLVVFKEKMTTGYFLFHLVGHLSYHLGQINYHRRLVAL